MQYTALAQSSQVAQCASVIKDNKRDRQQSQDSDHSEHSQKRTNYAPPAGCTNACAQRPSPVSATLFLGVRPEQVRSQHVLLRAIYFYATQSSPCVWRWRQPKGTTKSSGWSGTNTAASQMLHSAAL